MSGDKLNTIVVDFLSLRLPTLGNVARSTCYRLLCWSIHSKLSKTFYVSRSYFLSPLSTPYQIAANFFCSSVTSQSTTFGEGAGELSWSQEELDAWSKWRYENGFVLNPELTYPRRQSRAGTTDGLSLLIDPDIGNSFCPSTDSEGVKILFHLPLDAPRVSDLGILVGVDQEVYMELSPDLTVADEGISTFSHVVENANFYYFLYESYSPLVFDRMSKILLSGYPKMLLWLGVQIKILHTVHEK